MKVNSDELTLLRTYPQTTRLYLGVQQGMDIILAQVDGTHAPGATSILLKNVTGDDSELVRGMTVSLSGTATRNRHVSAVFLSYDSGTLTMTIGPNVETATNNQYVTIYSAFKLWRLEPAAFDGNQHIKPFAIAGPPRAGFVGQAFPFIGANAYSPIGRDLTDPAWHIFGDGDVLSGDVNDFNTAADPLVVSYPTAGEKIIRYKVADSEGEVHRTIRPVLVFDREGDNAPYSAFRINSMAYRGNGWSASITVYGVADSDEFPTEALVVIFAEDSYGSTAQSVGGPFRGMGDSVFSGWVRAGSTTVAADDTSITFTIDSVEVLAANLAMPSFTFRDGDDVTDWFHFDNLTLGKAALHILQQRTTLPLMADVFCATFRYELDLLDVPAAPLLDQLTQSILPACFGYVAGSRFASLTLARDRNFIDADGRAELKRAAISFTSDDWLSLKVDEDRFSGSALVRLEGKLGDDTPIAAQYPTLGAAHNGSIQVISGKLFKDLDQAAGLAGAIWKTGNRRVRGVTLRLPNYRVLEPAFQEYFTVYLPDAENQRGFNWVGELNDVLGKEFFCTGMTMSVGEEYMTVELTGSCSVYGPDGDAWVVLESPPTIENAPGYDQNATDDGATGTI